LLQGGLAMKVDRRVFLLAMCSTPVALAGCGGGSGNGGGGGFLTKSLGLSGAFRGMLTRAVNDSLDIDISLNGTTVTGAGRLIAAVGTDISSGTISGTFTGSPTSGVVSFTLTFDTGNLAGQTLSMTNATYGGTSNGYSVTVTVSGPYVLGAETVNVTLNKISDASADVTGQWTGNATSSVTGARVAVTADFVQNVNHLSGNGTANGVPFTLSGLIIADKITYGSLSGLNIDFTATVTGRNNSATNMSGSYSGSQDSGTFSLVRSGSSG
jgi:hypothetical protein